MLHYLNEYYTKKYRNFHHIITSTFPFYTIKRSNSTFKSTSTIHLSFEIDVMKRLAVMRLGDVHG
jgi:hypothetical protein